MSKTVIQLFFFCLIPVGIFILIRAIRLVKKSFNGDIILEIPFSGKISDFEITKPGVYSIWHKGQIFRKAPLHLFKPSVRNSISSEEIALIPSVFRPNTNNGRTGRTELFRFSAAAGKYQLKLMEGSSITQFEQAISNLFPLKTVDLANYFIQIRESQPLYYVVIGIFLLAPAGFLIIGGLVSGILADQLING